MPKEQITETQQSPEEKLRSSRENKVTALAEKLSNVFNLNQVESAYLLEIWLIQS